MALSTSLNLITISFILLSLSSLPAVNSLSSPAPNRIFSEIFAFGDSYTDTGNTRSSTGPYSYGYVSNPPYGTTYFHRSTNRYSDGRLVVDFLAAALSLPFLPPYRHPNPGPARGINFAVAGSTAIEHEFFARNNITMDITPESLETQLRWFEAFLARKGRRRAATMKGALFWVGEIGANDYAYSFTSSLSPELIRDLAVRKLSGFLKVLLGRGAKHVVVQGLPLTGCLPLAMILSPPDDRDEIGCSASVNNQSHTHNSLIQSKLRQLRRRYPDAIISFADYAGAHHAVMRNPAAHGFAERFKVCCGTGGGPYNFDIFSTCGSPGVSRACDEPEKFVNWDGVHLTEAMYKVVADMFFNHGYLQPSFDVLLGI